MVWATIEERIFEHQANESNKKSSGPLSLELSSSVKNAIRVFRVWSAVALAPMAVTGPPRRAPQMGGVCPTVNKRKQVLAEVNPECEQRRKLWRRGGPPQTALRGGDDPRLFGEGWR